MLIVKKRLVSQLNPPSLSGGGTVFYVAPEHHRFLSNRIERYEGGTPNVTGIYRLGVAHLFKQQLKLSFQKILAPKNLTLMDYDIQRAKTLQDRLKRVPNLVLIDGHSNAKKLPVFSFLIKCGQRFLHYNFVCALLNDIFGIQSRGGCQCAGPYAQFMLGMLDYNQAVESWLVHSKDELMRPGVTRLSLPSLGTTKVSVSKNKKIATPLLLIPPVNHRAYPLTNKNFLRNNRNKKNTYFKQWSGLQSMDGNFCMCTAAIIG